MSLAEVQDAVQAIQGWLDDPPGEAVVRQCIVLRLLLAAGFDIWNPQEIVPEETNAGGRRSDFLVRRGQGRFALEIKGMGVTLGNREYEQAVTYSVHEGSRWAVVTNGRKWVVLDEHLPGRYEQRAALTLEMGHDTEHFASDLYAVLSAEVWERDALEGAVAQVRARQQRRTDEAKIRREKTRVVEATQKEFEIATFGKAADAASKMGRITEAERDVLLGLGEGVPSVPQRDIEFTSAVGEARATAIYRPGDGSWTVKAGSTARRELLPGSSSRGVRNRRQKLLDEGVLTVLDDGLLVFARDLSHSSPSSAAADIAGGARNGWEVWRDTVGRPAQHHRPTKQAASP